VTRYTGLGQGDGNNAKMPWVRAKGIPSIRAAVKVPMACGCHADREAVLSGRRCWRPSSCGRRISLSKVTIMDEAMHRLIGVL